MTPQPQPTNEGNEIENGIFDITPLQQKCDELQAQLAAVTKERDELRTRNASLQGQIGRWMYWTPEHNIEQWLEEVKKQLHERDCKIEEMRATLKKHHDRCLIGQEDGAYDECDLSYETHLALSSTGSTIAKEIADLKSENELLDVARQQAVKKWDDLEDTLKAAHERIAKLEEVLRIFVDETRSHERVCDVEAMQDCLRWVFKCSQTALTPTTTGQEEGK